MTIENNEFNEFYTEDDKVWLEGWCGKPTVEDNKEKVYDTESKVKELTNALTIQD